jgi:hypothetical protein
MRFSHWIIRDARTHTHTHTHTHTQTLTLGIFNTKYFLLKQWLPELASVLSYTHIACLVQFHFADLNGTDLKCVKNVITYTNLYPCCLVNGFLFTVPVCRQPLVRLDRVRNLKNPQVLGNFNSAFFFSRYRDRQTDRQTDRHLIKGRYVIIHNNVANWREVYISLAILTAGYDLAPKHRFHGVLIWRAKILRN